VMVFLQLVWINVCIYYDANTQLKKNKGEPVSQLKYV